MSGTARHSEDLSVSRFWKEYTSFGADIDLTAVEGAQGRAARIVEMLEAGALRVKNADGVDCSITTSRAAGSRLEGEVGTILAAQTAKLLVIW